jgi:hypothetical protein
VGGAAAGGPGKEETVKGPPGAVNIGPRQRRIRRAIGIFFLAAGGVLALLLAAAGEPRLLRLTLFGLFAPGMLGLLQAREAT